MPHGQHTKNKKRDSTDPFPPSPAQIRASLAAKLMRQLKMVCDLPEVQYEHAVYLGSARITAVVLHSERKVDNTAARKQKGPPKALQERQ